MRKSAPESIFHEAPGIVEGACVSCNTCPYMKLNTMEKLYECMRTQQPELLLPEELMNRARLPLEKMLVMSQAL